MCMKNEFNLIVNNILILHIYVYIINIIEFCVNENSDFVYIKIVIPVELK